MVREWIGSARDGYSDSKGSQYGKMEVSQGNQGLHSSYKTKIKVLLTWRRLTYSFWTLLPWENSMIPFSPSRYNQPSPLDTMWWPPAQLLPVSSLSLPKWPWAFQAGSPSGDTDKSDSDTWQVPGPSSLFLYFEGLIPVFLRSLLHFSGFPRYIQPRTKNLTIWLHLWNLKRAVTQNSEVSPEQGHWWCQAWSHTALQSLLLPSLLFHITLRATES